MRNESNFFTISPNFRNEFKQIVLENPGIPVGVLFVKETDMENMPEHKTLMLNLIGASDNVANKMIGRMIDYTIVVEE